MPQNPRTNNNSPNGESFLNALRRSGRDDDPRGPGAAELESALIRLQKQLTLGRMAAEIAHDFGNLMTVLLGYSELLLADFAPDRTERAYLAELHQAAERAAALTGHLLSFSRQAREPVGPLDLGEFVRGLGGVLGALLSASARLTLRAEAGRGLILADASQVEQVVVNLVLNARDALTANGRIEVSVDPVRLIAPLEHALGTAPAGDYVRLRVRDTGAGLSAEARQKLFRPFFTTKPHGTGLGLAAVAGVARRCGAAVVVESEPGRDTTFDILFPRLPERGVEPAG